LLKDWWLPFPFGGDIVVFFRSFVFHKVV